VSYHGPKVPQCCKTVPQVCVCGRARRHRGFLARPSVSERRSCSIFKSTSAHAHDMCMHMSHVTCHMSHVHVHVCMCMCMHNTLIKDALVCLTKINSDQKEEKWVRKSGSIDRPERRAQRNPDAGCSVVGGVVNEMRCMYTCTCTALCKIVIRVCGSAPNRGEECSAHERAC
jgi:hypothetical protein